MPLLFLSNLFLSLAYPSTGKNNKKDIMSKERKLAQEIAAYYAENGKWPELRWKTGELRKVISLSGGGCIELEEHPGDVCHYVLTDSNWSIHVPPTSMTIEQAYMALECQSFYAWEQYADRDSTKTARWVIESKDVRDILDRVAVPDVAKAIELLHEMKNVGYSPHDFNKWKKVIDILKGETP